MEIKIVCCDLDGTLLDRSAKVSPENVKGIHALAEKGVYFVPSTGRSFSELPEAIRNHPAIRYFLCSNGSYVLDRETGERTLVCMSKETVQKIMAVLSEYDTNVTFRHDGKCVYDAALFSTEAFDRYNVCQPHRVVVKEFAVLEENFADFCRRAHEVEVVSVFFKTMEDRKACEKKILALGGLRVADVDPYNLEIMNDQAGKGNALRSLAALLGCDMAQTVAIGDSNNDESIVTAAGLGLAVSNAVDSLKEVADRVICSNDEHVLPYVLEHILS